MIPLLRQIKMAPPDALGQDRVYVGLTEISKALGLDPARVRAISYLPGLPTFKSDYRVCAKESEMRRWADALDKPREPSSNLLQGYAAITAYLNSKLPFTVYQIMWMDKRRRLPTFKVGRYICAHKSTLDRWLRDQLERRQRHAGRLDLAGGCDDGSP